MVIHLQAATKVGQSGSMAGSLQPCPPLDSLLPHTSKARAITGLVQSTLHQQSSRRLPHMEGSM